MIFIITLNPHGVFKKTRFRTNSNLSFNLMIVE